MKLNSEDAELLSQAVYALQHGDVIGLPTETVYGLAADAMNVAAVRKIFALKGRPVDHPLIVHIPGASHLERWAVDIPDLAYELAEDFWPGPLTLILRRAPGVPDAVTGGQDTVGLRVPGHPVALDLLRAFAAAGGTVLAWRNRRALEEELFASLSDEAVHALVEAAVENVGEERVDANIKSASSNAMDLSHARAGVTAATRDVSGRPSTARPGRETQATRSTAHARRWRPSTSEATGAPPTGPAPVPPPCACCWK